MRWMRRVRFMLAGGLVGLALRIMPRGVVRDAYWRSLEQFERDVLADLETR